MSYESLQSIDRSCVFRETFNNSSAVVNNNYSKGSLSTTGVSFKNGTGIFNKGTITYPNLKNVKNKTYTYRVVFKLLSYSTDYQSIVRLTDGSSAPTIIPISLGSVAAFNGTGYMNGVVQSGFPFIPLNKTIEFVCVFSTSSIQSILLGSYISNTFQANCQIDLFEIYNRALSAVEVKLLYQQRLYTQPNELPLLLDFDSTRGVLEDRTNINNFTITNSVSILQIGKVKSAYFNGTGFLNTVKTVNLYQDISFNIWFLTKSNGIDVARTLFGNGKTYLSIFVNKYFLTSDTATIDTTTATVKKNQWVNIFGFRKLIDGKGSYYINGVFDSILSSGVPSTNQNINLQIGSGGNSQTKGYISKLQIYKGIPSNPDQFTAQLYDSQKGQFGL